MFKQPRFLIAAATTAMLLTSCASGPVRRVSDPAVSFQQIQVLPSGNWNVDLRVHNYSSIPMRFDSVNLKMMVDGQEAASVNQAIGLTVGPESPDILKIQVTPNIVGKAAVADALTRKTTLNYRLSGTVSAAAEKRSAQGFKFNAASSLSPAPGLPGVLR